MANKVAGVWAGIMQVPITMLQLNAVPLSHLKTFSLFVALENKASVCQICGTSYQKLIKSINLLLIFFNQFGLGVAHLSH